MLLFDLTYYLTLFCLPFVIYSLFLRTNRQRSIYTNRDWFYLIKYFYAKTAVQRYQNRYRASLKRKNALKTLENVKEIYSDQHTDSHFVYGIDQNGNSLSLRLIIRANLIAEIYLNLRLENGGTFTLPDSNGIRLCSISSWQWKAKGLHLEILEPFRRLRLTFNHLLKQQQNGDLHQIQFNFIWTAGSSPKFYPQDVATYPLVDAVASEQWRDGNWLSLLGDDRGYTQFGTLYGFIKIDSNEQEIYLNLPSTRSRFWGTAERFSLERSVHLLVATANGTLVDLWMKSFKNGCSQLNYGYVLEQNGDLLPIESTDLRLKFFAPHRQLPPAFTINIASNHQNFKIIHHLKIIEKFKAINNEGNGYKLIDVPTFCTLNTQNGRSLLELWYNYRGDGAELPQPLVKELVTSSLPLDDVIELTNHNAKIVDLTGGKGSSLAILTSIDSDAFQVPEGFVVTVNAFRRQFDESFNMKTSIAILDEICCKRTRGDLEKACAETVRIVKNEKLSAEVVRQIRAQFDKLTVDGARWAVRSSGIGEDSEDLSQAGQNETFLGCSSFDDIIEAITACWASLFKYQSVQYRYQHGLPIRAEMAVVVQKMVPADCAGVLFTCHPTTCDPTQIIITANYGLGESVVSGQSDPDTIIVRRGFDQKLAVISKTPGKKNKIIKMAANGGTIQLVTDQTSKLCLTDQEILKLAKIGVKLEELCGNYRDIEWAYYENRLYLLQSRPITTLNQWTDYELTHEFDIATFSTNAIYTVANTGEVLPGAQSTLSTTTVLPMIDRAMQLVVNKDLEIFHFKCLAIFQRFVFLDVVGAIHKNPQRSVNLSSKILDLTIFGHPIINDDINRLSIERWGINNKRTLIEMIHRFKLAWYNEKMLKSMKNEAKKFTVGITQRDTITEIYHKIDTALNQAQQILKYHVITSGTSVLYQVIAMNVLAEQNTDFSVDHYNDIAALLSTCEDVVSAQIPQILERIVGILHRNGKLQEFCELQPDLVLDWLAEQCPEVERIFRDFLNEHGHRCIGEMDLMKQTWSMDPVQVIKIIQANSRIDCNKMKKSIRSIDDVINDLITPSSQITRKLLRFLMVRSRRAVGIREQSKSVAVYVINQIRTAYNDLSRRMCLGGLIPRSELIYHLSHYEVGLIIERSPKSPLLINKAVRRQRLHHQWNAQKFPELTYGIPSSTNNIDTHLPQQIDGLKCKGTPVCSGTVEARACVITTLDQIAQLKHGDILITYCTDIGWTPYFPLLTGIITELGGLVSHGAVIAREYGLPCIVGVQQVTQLFRTGDYVRLCGKTGSVQLLSRNNTN